ncbi:MAG: hypothetical protein EP343_11525 [Deltaproteobacteria bacterium]|nr:MAG: hypothetical protein EP343_11525 [Deltaproteobacteria bacterium]
MGQQDGLMWEATQLLLHPESENEQRTQVVQKIAELSHHADASETLRCVEAIVQQLTVGCFHDWVAALWELVHSRPEATSWRDDFLDYSEGTFNAALRYYSALKRHGDTVSATPQECPNKVWNIELHRDVDGYLAWRSLGKLFPTVINVCSYDKEARRDALSRRSMRDAVQELQGVFPDIHHLHTFLEMMNEETLIVLHPQRQQGFEVVVSGICHMQEFQPILEATLHGDPDEGWLDAPRQSQAVLDCFQGKGPMQTDLVTTNSWSYFSWPALCEDGRVLGKTHLEVNILDQDVPVHSVLRDVDAPESFGGEHQERASEQPLLHTPEHDIAPNRFWVESNSTPHDFLSFDGKRVVLITNPISSVQWRAFRSYPYLAGEMEVKRIFTQEEVNAWLEQLLERKSSVEYTQHNAQAYVNFGNAIGTYVRETQLACLRRGWSLGQLSNSAECVYDTGLALLLVLEQTQQTEAFVEHARSWLKLLDDWFPSSIKERMEARNNVVGRAFNMDLFSFAEEVFDSCLADEFMEDEVNRSIVVHTLNIGAQLFKYVGREAEVLPLLERTVNLAQSLGSLEYIRQLSMSVEELMKGDVDALAEAIGRCNQVLSLLMETLEFPHPSIGLALFRASQCCARAGMLEQAAHCFDVAQSHFDNTVYAPDADGLQILIKEMQYYTGQRFPQHALYLAQKAQTVAAEILEANHHIQSDLVNCINTLEERIQLYREEGTFVYDAWPPVDV